MTITLEQAAERFIPHEFTIDGLDKWLTNQNIDVDGDSRFFHSWHHYENALDEANANVCIRELKGMDATVGLTTTTASSSICATRTANRPSARRSCTESRSI